MRGRLRQCSDIAAVSLSVDGWCSGSHWCTERREEVVGDLTVWPSATMCLSFLSLLQAKDSAMQPIFSSRDSGLTRNLEVILQLSQTASASSKITRHHWEAVSATESDLLTVGWDKKKIVSCATLFSAGPDWLKCY
jgi:hypothetical protein